MTATRTKRFPLMLSPEEVEAIDGYRWERKISTQAKAVRELIEKGLRAAKSEGASAPTPAPSVAT